MRALWKGILTFGSVRAPVKLYTAVRETRVDFDLLHDADLAPLRQEMVCSIEQIPVDTEHRLKGFEVAPGEYVVVTPEELDGLRPEPGRDIEIVSFVPYSEIDPRYIERTYYLGPDEDARDYAVLAAALEENGIRGVCRWVMRNRSYLGAVSSQQGMLMLATLRYADEVVGTTSFSLPDVAISERELELALYLVDELTGEFTPDKYTAEYPQRVRKLIEQKARGEEVETPAPVETAPTPDEQLVKALETSLKEARKRRAA